MAKVEFTMEEKVAVVSLNDGENRFNPEFLEAFLRVLDTSSRRQRPVRLWFDRRMKKYFATE